MHPDVHASAHVMWISIPGNACTPESLPTDVLLAGYNSSVINLLNIVNLRPQSRNPLIRDNLLMPGDRWTGSRGIPRLEAVGSPPLVKYSRADARRIVR